MIFSPISSFTDSVGNSVDTLVSSLEFLPALLLALIILFVGWVVGSVLRRGIESVFQSMPFIDATISKSVVGVALDRAQVKPRVGVFFGILVEVFVVLIVALIAFDVLGMQSFSNYIKEDLLGYIPHIFSAVVVLVAGGLVATFIKRFISGTGRIARLEYASTAGIIAQWAVWIFTILIAVSELGIATGIIQSIIFGLITALTLAFGLAFGLGGQDAAADFIRKVREEVRK